jgi:hypothetical protein
LDERAIQSDSWQRLRAHVPIDREKELSESCL